MSPTVRIAKELERIRVRILMPLPREILTKATEGEFLFDYLHSG